MVSYLYRFDEGHKRSWKNHLVHCTFSICSSHNILDSRSYTGYVNRLSKTVLNIFHRWRLNGTQILFGKRIRFRQTWTRGDLEKCSNTNLIFNFRTVFIYLLFKSSFKVKQGELAADPMVNIDIISTH